MWKMNVSLLDDEEYLNYMSVNIRSSASMDLHHNIWLIQEKMRGQRGRLPVQALGYVDSTKVILGLPETAGVHFLLRPHHYILR